MNNKVITPQNQIKDTYNKPINQQIENVTKITNEINSNNKSSLSNILKTEDENKIIKTE